LATVIDGHHENRGERIPHFATIMPWEYESAVSNGPFTTLALRHAKHMESP